MSSKVPPKPVTGRSKSSDQQRGESVRVGFFARGKRNIKSVAQVLSAVGEVFQVSDLTDIRTEMDCDLLVVQVDLTSVGHINDLKTCRDRNPLLPIIMMARNADPDVAVEVSKLLNLDFLSSPHETDEELRLKCSRGLFPGAEPTLVRPFLAPLVPEGSGIGMDRRRVFRALVPSYWSSTARTSAIDPPLILDLEDLSVAYEGQPGGLLLRMGRKAAHTIAKSVDDWGRGARIDLMLALANETMEIPVACRVVRIPKPTSENHFHFAVEYQVDSQQSETALMRFWTNCQMQERRKGRAGGRS